MPFQSSTTSSSFGLPEKRNGFKGFREEKKNTKTPNKRQQQQQKPIKHCTQYLSFKVVYVSCLFCEFPKTLNLFTNGLYVLENVHVTAWAISKRTKECVGGYLL